MDWPSRVANYETVTKFPKSLFVAADNRVVGTWIMGNSYKVQSGFYGGYPPTYLRRIKALFPDKTKPLHLFSGKVDTETFPGDTVDIDPANDPTYLDDAQTLEKVPLETYDLVLCDPPYSVEDSEHYKTSMVSRKRVIDALARCKRGTHLVILDQVLWMWRKDTWDLEAVIGCCKSSNHRFRIITIFCRR